MSDETKQDRWVAEGRYVCQTGTVPDYSICWCKGTDDADYIAACLNACDGVDDPQEVRMTVAALTAERARLMDGIGRLLAFTSHKPDCRFITTPADWTCDCGLSTAIMVVMNPHMDVAATITESEATDDNQ